MHVSRKKFGFDSDEDVEVMNLHMKAEDADSIVDNKTIFPGFHMNKKTWFSICLDGSVSHERMVQLIKNSYELAKK